MVLTNLKTAKMLKKQNKSENLNLKRSQIIIVSSIFPLKSSRVEKLSTVGDAFQYFLKRPVSPRMFKNVLTHLVRGLSLYNESTTTDVTTPASTADKRLAGLRILLIDDNDCVRRALGRQVKRFSPHVVECEDGLKGLMAFQAAAEKGFDFVMVDYMMPQMNGIEVVEAIRKFESGQGASQRATILRIMNGGDV